MAIAESDSPEFVDTHWKAPLPDRLWWAYFQAAGDASGGDVTFLALLESALNQESQFWFSVESWLIWRTAGVNRYLSALVNGFESLFHGGDAPALGIEIFHQAVGIYGRPESIWFDWVRSLPLLVRRRNVSLQLTTTHQINTATETYGTWLSGYAWTRSALGVLVPRRP